MCVCVWDAKRAKASFLGKRGESDHMPKQNEIITYIYIYTTQCDYAGK